MFTYYSFYSLLLPPSSYLASLSGPNDYTPSSVSFYVNGVYWNTTNWNNGQIGAQGQRNWINTPVRVGKYDNSDPNLQIFPGKVDEVRFWNYPRSQVEILDQIHKKLTGSESGLIAYFAFDVKAANLEDTTR